MCQGAPAGPEHYVQPFKAWAEHCTSKDTVAFPNDVPEGTTIPGWADKGEIAGDWSIDVLKEAAAPPPPPPPSSPSSASLRETEPTTADAQPTPAPTSPTSSQSSAPPPSLQPAASQVQASNVKAIQPSLPQESTSHSRSSALPASTSSSPSLQSSPGSNPSKVASKMLPIDEKAASLLPPDPASMHEDAIVGAASTLNSQTPPSGLQAIPTVDEATLDTASLSSSDAPVSPTPALLASTSSDTTRTEAGTQTSVPASNADRNGIPVPSSASSALIGSSDDTSAQAAEAEASGAAPITEFALNEEEEHANRIKIAAISGGVAGAAILVYLVFRCWGCTQARRKHARDTLDTNVFEQVRSTCNVPSRVCIVG